MPKKEKRYVINRGLNRVAYASIEKVDTTKDNLLLVHENADGEDSNSKSVMTMSLTWWQNFPWTMANRNADKHFIWSHKGRKDNFNLMSAPT